VLAARWAGRGSGAQGWAPKIVSAKRLETILGALDAGGANPDNPRRSDPLAVTSFRRSARSARRHRPGRGAGGRGSGIRRGPQRPVTGGAVRGSRRAWWASAQRARRKAAAPQRRDPQVEPRPQTAGHPGRSFPRNYSRPSSLLTAWAVRPGVPKVRERRASARARIEREDAKSRSVNA
jgi:hypothetical protein